MEFLSGLALGLLLNILVIVGRDFGHLTVARVFMAFLLATTAFLLLPFVPDPYHNLVQNIQVMVPALFWLLCQFAFNDRPRLKTVWSVMAAYSVIAPSSARFFWADQQVTPMMGFFGWRLGEVFEYCLLLNGLWIIISNWSNDLVESRRKLRIAMLIVVGFAVSTAVVSLNFGLAGECTRAIIVSTSAFIISIFLIKGKEGVLFGEGQFPSIQNHTIDESSNNAVQAEEPEPEVQLMPEEARLLKETMEQGFYRTENLTLKILAKEIGLPEYKARSLINQTLGYRNFNDYINQLRITDATKRLIESPDEPILNISLDVGYRSISSFNRAFKDIVGMSPTRYREEKTGRTE